MIRRKTWLWPVRIAIVIRAPISLTREIVRLFHPRRDVWENHFEYSGAILEGRSPVGLATIRLLQINTVERVEMRAELLNCGDM